jgi:hypothetical protein
MTTADDHRADERARRELADKHRGDVVEGSASPVVGRRLDQVISLRLEPDLVVALRNLAEQQGTTMSDLLRQGALRVLAEAAEPVLLATVRIEKVMSTAWDSVSDETFDTRGANLEYAVPAISR